MLVAERRPKCRTHRYKNKLKTSFVFGEMAKNPKQKHNTVAGKQERRLTDTQTRKKRKPEFAYVDTQTHRGLISFFIFRHLNMVFCFLVLEPLSYCTVFWILNMSLINGSPSRSLDFDKYT